MQKKHFLDSLQKFGYLKIVNPLKFKMNRHMDETFGFELLNKLVGNQIFKKEDVIILFVHWYMVKSGFKCIGLGDSKIYNGTEETTESVPEGWNTGPNYTIRYAKDQKLYILIGLKSDFDILINLLRVQDNVIGNVQFPVAQTINELHGPLNLLIPLHREVMHKLRTDLIEPLNLDVGRSISTQTTISTNERDIPLTGDYDPLRVGRPRPIPAHWDPRADPRTVGRGDLSPFGEGGGMIFDPFGRPQGLRTPGRLPPGARIPGARFDPFGPPDIEPPPFPRRNPNSNDMFPQAPGYDDMFM